MITRAAAVVDDDDVRCSELASIVLREMIHADLKTMEGAG